MTAEALYPTQSKFLPLMDYGDLELPEFSDEQEALRGLSLEFDDFLGFVKGLEGGIEGLESLQASHSLRNIDARLSQFVEQEVKKLGLSDELSMHAANAVRKKQWEGVPEGSSEKFALRELITRANRLKAQLIQHWFENAEDTGFNPVAEAEYKHVVYAMAAADRLSIKILTEKFPIDSKERERRGLKNECAIVKEIAGEVKEVPFHEAYPEETDATVACYEDLLAELDQLRDVHEEAPGLVDLINRKCKYYSALIKAYITSDVKDWNFVDSILTAQIREDGNDVFHVHPIETGYLGDGMLRFPEVGLRTPDLNQKEAHECSLEVKKTMIDSLQNSKYFGASPAVAQTLDLIVKSNATFRHFLGSGLENDLKITGQVIPNDEKARTIGGIDTSLDMDSIMKYLPDKRETFQKIFGEEALQAHCDHRNLPMAITRFTVSHELGHSVAVLPDTHERLGGKDFIMGPFVEEWKASAAGIIANECIPHSEGAIGIDRLKSVIIDHLLIGCRYAAVRNGRQYKNYFRKSMIFMKLMEESGILECDEENVDNPWKINVEDDRVLDFYGRLFEQFKDLVRIYGEGNEQDLRDFLGEALQSSDFTNFLCDRLVVPVPDQEKNTAANIATLPAARAEVAGKSPDEIADETKGEVSAVPIPSDD